MPPAVGFSCNKISFAVVVLPQPDSPISPRVSPGKIAKSTDSTALTQATRRRAKLPVLTGKHFRSPSTSSTGAVIGLLRRRHRRSPAIRGPIGSEPRLFGLVGRAAGQRIPAARMERASRRQLREIRRLTRNREQRLFAAKFRDRTKQGTRI